MSIKDDNVSLDKLMKIKWMFEEQQKIAHFGTFEWDIKSNDIYWSDESYKIYGLTTGSKINYDLITPFRHPDDRESIDNFLKKEINKKTHYKLNYRIIKKDGQIRHIEVNGKVYSDENGSPLSVLGTMQDVTEYQEMQMDQSFKANLLAAVNEVIIATDAHGVLKYINSKAEETCEITASEFVGRHYTSLFEKVKPDCPLEKVKEKLATEGSCIFEASIEIGIENKCYEVRSKMIRDGNGEYNGTVSAARDITQRKTSEATISRQNTILKQINEMYKLAMCCESVEKLGNACLDIMESVTGSRLSYIEEVGQDDSCQILACNALDYNLNEDFIKLKQKVTMQDNTVMLNDLSQCKLPDAHPQIRTFLGVPYKRGERIAGWLGVANREGGYTEEHKEILEALAPPILEALISKRAEVQLRENESLMRTIMDSASDFMFLKDKNSRIVMVNQAYGRVFNVNIADVIGKNDFDLYPNIEMASNVIENDRLVIQTGKTLICQESAMTADGYKTYSLSKVPWRDKNGEIIGVLGTAHDITELNQAKNSLQDMVATLKHSNEYIELLHETTGKILSSRQPQKDIDNLCDKVMRFLNCDSYFNYLYNEGDAYLQLNACQGISPEAIKEVELLPVGAAVCGFALQQRRRIVAENIQRADDQSTNLLKSIGIRAYACHPLMTDNEILGTLAFGTCLRDSFEQEELMLMNAVAKSAAVSLRRKRTEEKLCKQAKELELKNKLIMDFFINVSHEFKTPLSILKLAAELMENNYQNGKYEKMSSYLEMIRSNSNRLTKLVGNLLDMTKVDAGFMSPMRSLVDIVSLLDHIVQSIRLFASKRDLTLTYFSNIPSKLIYTDSAIIERIVLNLLSNALKHTQRGGKINVEFLNCNEKVLIVVNDNGEGIPDDKKDIVFDRFRQVNNSLSRANEGCGIGLALSKSLIELLDGRIWLKSTYGKGSAFFVEFPAVHANIDEAVMTIPENIENSILIEFSDINFY